MQPWFRKHAIWVVPLGGLALTTAGYWVKSVNANGTSVVQLTTTMPQIQKQIEAVDQKLDKLDGRTQEMNQRLSNIEGRIRR